MVCGLSWVTRPLFLGKKDIPVIVLSSINNIPFLSVVLGWQQMSQQCISRHLCSGISTYLWHIVTQYVFLPTLKPIKRKLGNIQESGVRSDSWNSIAGYWYHLYLPYYRYLLCVTYCPSSSLSMSLPQVEQLTKDWSASWRDKKELLEQYSVDINRDRAGFLINSFQPHLVTLDGDVLSTGVVFYHLRVWW